jgi:hypothetical protein
MIAIIIYLIVFNIFLQFAFDDFLTTKIGVMSKQKMYSQVSDAKF